MRDVKFASARRILTGQLWLLGLGLGLLYWIVESALDALVHREVFTERLWPEDPNELWMRFTLVLLLLAGGVGAQFLIDRRRRAEMAARESESRTRAILETVPDAIITATRQGEILSFNRGAERIFGYEAAEVLGQPLSTLMPERLREAHAEGLRRYLETGEARVIGQESVELSGLRKNGEEFPLALSLGESREGESVVFTGIIRDITERKAAEEKTSEQTRHVLLQAEIGAALGEGGTLRETLQRCAEVADERLETAFFRIWTLDEEEQVLELQASAGMYTHLDGPHGRVPVGELKIGLIASERQPRLTNEVLQDPRVGDKEWARREGMVAFAGHPLIVEDRLVGVMATFAQHPLGEETREALANMASVIAQGIERKRAEEAVSRAEVRFRQVFDQSADALLVHDDEGRIVDCNLEAYRSLGYTRAEMLDLRMRDLATNLRSKDEDERSAAEPGLWQRAMAGEPGQAAGVHVGEHRRKDGTRFPVEVLVSPLQYGERRLILASVRDITERQRAEEEIRELNESLERRVEERTAELEDAVRQLRSSEERYTLVMWGTNDGVWDWNIFTGEIFWNDRFYELLGLSASEVSPSFELFAELVHPDDRQRVLEAVTAHLEHGETYDEEFRMRHASGEYRYCLGRGKALRDGGGNPFRMAGSVTDITGRRRAEEEIRRLNEDLERRVEERTTELQTAIAGLRESEARTELILEAASDGIWEADLRTGKTFWNDSLYELYGLSPGEIEPSYEAFLGQVHPEDRPGVAESINRCSYIQARAVEILSYVAWDLSAVGGDAAAIGASRR